MDEMKPWLPRELRRWPVARKVLGVLVKPDEKVNGENYLRLHDRKMYRLLDKKGEDPQEVLDSLFPEGHLYQEGLTERKKETLAKGWREPPEWLFYTGNGSMIDGDNFRRRIHNKALEKAGLRHVRIHDLRHTYATLRIGKGDNIQDVSKQLGHHSIKITIDTYSHWMPGAKKSEVDGLDSKTDPTCTLSAPCEENNEKAAM
jgi:integrase